MSFKKGMLDKIWNMDIDELMEEMIAIEKDMQRVMFKQMKLLKDLSELEYRLKEVKKVDDN